MAKVQAGLYSILPRGHFPYPYIVGFNIYPSSYKGLYNAEGWIYQTRRTWHGLICVAEKYYTPYNPRTVPQQNNRQKFADGVAEWHTMSDSQKKKYNDYARKRGRISGFTYFMSLYMKDRI